MVRLGVGRDLAALNPQFQASTPSRARSSRSRRARSALTPTREISLGKRGGSAEGFRWKAGPVTTAWADVVGGPGGAASAEVSVSSYGVPSERARLER